ncbi:MAG: hypothetical protein B6U97_04900 [Candidatus Altiarchaeales archaeon ex4484_96]|nr:MAG: hypothetical protein B6U97_04900 [Candidatus Altiarchaeales archaeon ex4484_96]
MQERDEWRDYEKEVLDDLPDWVNPKDAEAILVMRKQNQQAQFEEYRNLEHLKKQFNRLPAGKRKAVKKLMLSDGVLLDEALGMVMR